MKVLVVTCAHRGDDARIVHRQIGSMIGAGHQVTLIAPEVDDRSLVCDPPGLRRITIERASGRRRLRSWSQARWSVRKHALESDVILVHDIELVPIVGTQRRRGSRLVWDVHEAFDEVARTRDWLPWGTRLLVRKLVRAVQEFGRRRFTVIVAESSYLRTFPGAVVVPNSSWVVDRPEPVDIRRVVYIGRLSYDRGLEELIAIGRSLREAGGPRLEVIGQVDASAKGLLERSALTGDVEWHGPLPNPLALSRVAGALAGLSLLHDIPNYRISMPTKLLEYSAVGVPSITTPLPLARQFVEQSGGGLVTSFFDGVPLVDEVVEFVLRLDRTAELRDELGRRAWSFAKENYNWREDSKSFLRVIESESGLS